MELPEIFPQRAAALEVPGDVDGVLEGRKKKGEKKQEAENIRAVQGASCHPAPVGKWGRFGAVPTLGGGQGAHLAQHLQLAQLLVVVLGVLPVVLQDKLGGKKQVRGCDRALRCSQTPGEGRFMEI